MKILTSQKETAKLAGNTTKRRFKGMTVGIVVACKDGIIIGADRKVTRSRGTRIKSLEDKIYKLSFKDGRNFLVCSSGGADLAKRAITEIDPSGFREDADCSFYRDIIEGRISRLQSSLNEKGIQYDVTLLFGTIDIDGKPTIGHITTSGLTETKNDGYFTTGIAAPYAELVLQDSYSPSINVEDAKLIVGGLVQKIGQVDNDVEGMDVFTILKTDKKFKELSWAERRAIEEEPLSFNFKDELDALKAKIAYWQKLLEKVQRKAVKKIKKEQQLTDKPESKK
jgi:20S proteasome alpha/beta subunit